MIEPHQKQIQDRAAELRAVAAEMDRDEADVVERSRGLQKRVHELRRERYGSRWSNRAGKPEEDR